MSQKSIFHELTADENGDTFACLFNLKSNIGIKLKFNKRYLPKFVQWKSIASETM